MIYTQWISRWIATVRERIPGSIDNIDNDVTGVSECSQQRGNLKDNGCIKLFIKSYQPLVGRS
ncbi:hypothetical protein [Photorhabdus laumondii]|uniref:hypothetical protein n=1 Tax=Photorhabdus laumondii TaxID=2218628 RepID=UPI000AC97992|nr:hypothetical protein [Photorhabdus laumondii]NDL49513.1 hypothetical protein [Photorhabdus laumondii subsp. laumondii]